MKLAPSFAKKIKIIEHLTKKQAHINVAAASPYTSKYLDKVEVKRGTERKAI